MLTKIIEIVRECGGILLDAADVEEKSYHKEGKGNWVTEYDSRVQALLREKLLALLPEAAFLAEEDEMDHTDISKGYAFIVDPIDGTANFTRGCRMSCVCVALAKDGVPVMGVVYQPYRDEMFYAERGKGAYCNGRPIHASQRTLAEGLVLFGTTPYYEELAEKSFATAYRYFRAAEDLRRSGSAALDLCDLARGRAEFFFELMLSPWDYAAASVIVEEAGGIVSDLEGRPVTFDHKQTVAARGPRVELLPL